MKDDTLRAALADREAAIRALMTAWATRKYGQHAGYLTAPEVVDLVLNAAIATPQPAAMSAPAASGADVEHCVTEAMALSFHRAVTDGPIGKDDLEDIMIGLRAALNAIAPAAPVAEALPCGHPASLLLRSAEGGSPLYCELCDARSGRRDAEQMEAEHKTRADKAELDAAVLREELAQLGYTFRDGLLYPPTGARWEHLCKAAGLIAAPAAAGSAEPAQPATQEAGPVAWSPAYTTSLRTWTNGTPDRQTVDYWSQKGVAIAYAYEGAAPQAPAATAAPVWRRLTDGEASRYFWDLKVVRAIESALARINGATLTDSAHLEGK